MRPSATSAGADTSDESDAPADLHSRAQLSLLFKRVVAVLGGRDMQATSIRDVAELTAAWRHARLPLERLSEAVRVLALVEVRHQQ